MCNRECEHGLTCPHEDCISDEVSEIDYQLSNSIDAEIKETTLDKHQLARKMANKRYREKHRDILRTKDRERYKGERKKSVNETSKIYNEIHREEINVMSLNNYHRKRKNVG